MLYAWVQARLNHRNKTIVNRRVDWLVFVLTNGVAEAFMVKAQAQATGVILNHQELKFMNNAILSAKEQPDGHVRWLSLRTAAVRSKTREGAEYNVRLPEEGSGTEVACDCQANHMRKMC